MMIKRVLYFFFLSRPNIGRDVDISTDIDFTHIAQIALIHCEYEIRLHYTTS